MNKSDTHYFLQEQYEGITLDGIEVFENGAPVEHFFSASTNYADLYVVDQWRNVKFI